MKTLKVNEFELIDTHCHIHDSEFLAKYDKTADEIVEESLKNGVSNLICVGTSVKSSIEAAKLAKKHPSVHASLAIHPHEAETKKAEEYSEELLELEALLSSGDPSKIVAIGECGLDYYYHESQEVRLRQKHLFELHIKLALKYDLPLIFHIRDAFDDFFAILDDYEGVRGVVHSFSTNTQHMQEVVKRGLYIGLNGIMTFTKDKEQLDSARKVPIENLVIETDSPFLTPTPFRGKLNEPKHVISITKFMSELRGESQAFLAKQTTKNAKTLFNL